VTVIGRDEACHHALPFADPGRGSSICGLLRSTPVLWGFGPRAFRPRTVPAVSPTFSRCAPYKPGDPPPPSRPAGAKASDRIRSLSRPQFRGFSNKRKSHDYR